MLATAILASGFLKAATTADPGEAYQHYLKAMMHESEGNQPLAQEELDKAIEISPESGYLYRMSAEISFRLGQLDKAVDAVEKAINLDPKNSKLYILAGQIYWARNYSTMAEKRLKRAVELAPDEAEPLIKLTVAGAPIDQDVAVIEAGVDFRILPAASVGISYTGQYGARASENALNARMRVQF